MKLNKYIDHTLLKQDATVEQIDSLLSEAREHDFRQCLCESFLGFLRTFWSSRHRR